MALDLDAACEVLERTPRVLQALLGGLSAPWLESDEGPGSFRPVDVVGHLLHGERTDWIPRARMILEQGESRAFEPFDRHGHVDDVKQLAPPDLLAAFAEARAGSLATLRDLRIGPPELERRGRHPAFGRVTLAELLAAWVVHDLGHVRQVCRVLAGRYAQAVGPWRAYLPVLDEGPRGGRRLVDEAIEAATLVRAEPEAVYEALATAEGLDAWFTEGAEVDARPGGAIRFRWRDWGPDRITGEDGGTVLEAERGRRFVFQWHPDGPDYATTVAVDLEPDAGGGTVIRLTESGYRDTASGRRALLSCATGWGEALALLKAHVESRP